MREFLCSRGGTASKDNAQCTLNDGGDIYKLLVWLGERAQRSSFPFSARWLSLRRKSNRPPLITSSSPHPTPSRSDGTPEAPDGLRGRPRQDQAFRQPGPPRLGPVLTGSCRGTMLHCFPGSYAAGRPRRIERQGRSRAPTCLEAPAVSAGSVGTDVAQYRSGSPFVVSSPLSFTEY